MFISSSGRARGHRRRITTVVATVATGLCIANLTHVTPAAASAADLVDASVDASSPSAAPIGDLPGWRQIFVDNFSTDVALGSFPEAVSGKWTAYPSPWTDSIGHGTYNPHKTISIANGILNEYIHTSSDGTPMVAAPVPKVPGSAEYGQRYGRYAVRFRADVLPGYKVAWLLWPDSGNQTADGEIDFPERNLDDPQIKGFVHHTDALFDGDQDNVKVPFDGTQWHTTIIEWSPNLIVFRLDGVEILRSTERIPDNPMHWVLQTETRINPSTRPPADVAGNVQIDWVAAWAFDRTIDSPDLAAPKVSVSSIDTGDVVSGTVSLGATAVDTTVVSAVKWYVDGDEVAYDGGVAPWSDPWNSNTVANGSHTLMAKARDDSGNWGSSPIVTFRVSN